MSQQNLAHSFWMSILDENKKRETKEIYHSSRGRWRSASQVDQL